MLKPAGEKLLDVLADVEVDDPTVPYVSNTTAEFITSKDEVKELLGRQVYSSVCWEQSIEKMIADGADTFVEIGPEEHYVDLCARSIVMSKRSILRK